MDCLWPESALGAENGGNKKAEHSCFINIRGPTKNLPGKTKAEESGRIM